jgi:phosphomannomutase
MNFELDGTFPSHQPDPLVFENYAELMKRVVDEKADLGIAPDGDGDRIFFVDEKGEMIPASMITALVARELLKKYPGERILYDIRYVMTPRQIIKENGGTSSITRVGHAFITKQLHEEGGIFGGESSGHMFLRATGGAESQATIILIVLKAISDANKPLSEIIEEIRRSYESGEFNFKTNAAAHVLDELKKRYADAQISLLDGVSIEYPTWRFNVRTSNTEPLMRLNVEAETKLEMEGKRDELIAFISTFDAVLQKSH